MDGTELQRLLQGFNSASSGEGELYRLHSLESSLSGGEPNTPHPFVCQRGG